MKALYWALLVIALVLLLLGFVYFQSPFTDKVDQTLLDQYFVQSVIWGLVVGAVFGVAFGLLAERTVRVRPREEPGSFHGRVALFGIVGGVVALLLAGALAAFLASAQSAWQITEGERVKLVIGSGRFLAVPAAALLGGLAVFALVTRARTWNGRRAIV
jgi:heme/copper-type cytochrome/quinol oxidase subunit 2